jgi:flagellar motor switch protein FliG
LAEEVAYKELELELDLESRFLSRLERIVGEERVMLEVDIILEYIEIKSNEPQLSLRRVSGLPPRPAKLPGFARIKQEIAEKLKKDKKLEMTGMTVKLILDNSLSNNIIETSKQVILGHPVFNSVEGANLTVETVKMVVAPDISTSLKDVADGMNRSISSQLMTDSLRLVQDEKKFNLASQEMKITGIAIGAFALILIIGIYILLRGIDKIVGQQQKSNELSVNLATPATPAAPIVEQDKEMNISINHPIELLPPEEKEEKEKVARPYSPFAFMRNLSNEDISNLCKGSSVKTIEILANYLPPNRTAWLLNQLDDETLKQVSTDLASGQVWPKASVESVKEELLEKYKQMINPDEIKSGGVHNYATLLTSSPQVSSLSDRVLNLIGEGTNGELRKQVFPFKDIIEVNSDDLKSVLTNVDRGDIAFALLEQDEELVEKVLGSMQPDMARSISKRMNLLENIAPDVIYAAQRRIVDALRPIVMGDTNENA